MRQFHLGAATGVVLLGLGFGTATADPAGDAAIAYRKDIMGVVGNHMKAIAAIVKGAVPYSGDLPVHTEGLARALSIALAAFGKAPVEPDAEKTTAKPEIWSEAQKFADDMKAAQDDAQALVAVAAGGDRAAIGAKLGALGKDCKSCHDDFRTR